MRSYICASSWLNVAIPYSSQPYPSKIKISADVSIPKLKLESTEVDNFGENDCVLNCVVSICCLRAGGPGERLAKEGQEVGVVQEADAVCLVHQQDRQGKVALAHASKDKGRGVWFRTFGH